MTDKNNNPGFAMFAPILLSKDEYENGGVVVRRREVVRALVTHDIFYNDLYDVIASASDYDDEILDALEASDAETVMRGIEVRMEEQPPIKIPRSDSGGAIVAVNALLVVKVDVIIRAIIGDARFEKLVAAF